MADPYEQPLDYDTYSWKLYNKCKKSQERNGKDREELPSTYLSSPADIKKRAKQVRWLNSLMLEDWVMDMIMTYDSPHISVVRKLVLNYGKRGASIRLTKFMQGLENGKCKSPPDNGQQRSSSG